MADAPNAAPTTLSQLDPEVVRFGLERSLLQQLEASPGFAHLKKAIVPADPAEVRRRLIGDALRLTESMAPAAYEYARAAQQTLGIGGALEIYQSAGRENAALHLVDAPILLEIQGRLMVLLDPAAGRALFGHELGHYVAHGPATPTGAASFVAVAAAMRGLIAPGQAELARRLSVAREITADRFGLLACQSLDAALRLEMIATTGLSGEALTWDTEAYLTQCRSLMESVAAGDTEAISGTHPEHSLRAWATWLFSQTDVYRQLTGSGPATRTLAEVDAQIEAVLGASKVHSVAELHDEPPQFLLECALAGSVLVAQADGEIAPEELAAIEDAFGRTVPGWPEFLDTDVALERFYETAAMVTAGGTDLARRLFLLLTHVMGADDVVDPREVQMVLSIGEALSFAKEFRDWLEPAVAAMGGQLEADSIEPVAVPLPAKKGEIREALAAFCDGVQRRALTRISPRRLLRIAGAAPGDAKAIARVDGLLLARKITATPPLPDCPPDTLMELRAEVAQAPRDAEAEPLDETRASVIAGLTRLRDELISGDGRSPAVRLRAIRRGRAFDLFRLDAVRTGAAERALTLIRSGKPATLVTPADAGQHDAAQSCVEELRLLDRANTDRREETGANDLYLGYPTVVGNVAPRGEANPGYGVRAPLVLYPVTLQRDGRGARGFSIRPRPDEEPTTNHSLLRLLFNKADLAMPDELLADLDEIVAEGGQDAAPLLAKLTEVGLTLRAESTTLGPYKRRDDDLDAKPPFLALEECALLGIFPQSSSDLLQDYDALLSELADPAASLDALLAAGVGLLPASLSPDSFVNEQPAPGWPVLDADPSQRDVLAACDRNRVTVVDGPPGTGKSQVIVNLVADALRRGQRVAVVAEKRAALDVVFQRLDGLGLGDAAAVVHDARDDRKALFARIRERIEAKQSRTANDTRLAILRADFDKAEQTLETRRQTLAHKKDGVGLTVGQLLALVAAGPACQAPSTLLELDRNRLQSLVELTERLHPYADLWAPESWWRTQAGATTRPGLHTTDDAGMVELSAKLDAAIAAASTCAQALANGERTAAQLDAARPGIEALHTSATLATTDLDRELLAALLAHPSVDVAATTTAWSKNSTALVKWSEPTALEQQDVLARESAVLKSYAGRLLRFLSPTWWRSRSALRKALAHAWPERAGASFDATFLDEVQTRVAAARSWSATQQLFDALGLGHRAPARREQADALLGKLTALSAVARQIGASQGALAALDIAIPTPASPVMPEASLAAATEQLAALDGARASVAPLQTPLPWLADPSLDTLRTLKDRLAIDGARLREADGWLAQADETHAAARATLDAVASALPQSDATTWREAITRAWASLHLDTIRTALPQLQSLGTTAEAQTIKRAAEAMRNLDLEIRKLEVDTIAAQLDGADLLEVPDAKYRARRTPEQKIKEHLLKEVSKSRRRMPLRQFVRTFAKDGLLDIVPCWLVSPETMAVLFERKPLFDLVIFDEASQCTVESGFPVALRAKRVVVAGDDKQMPPTSFFTLGSADEDDADLSEQSIAARDAFAAESLLVLARNRCAHVGLKWHYRCRSEELIAYSNHSMYDGSLLTIPSTAGPHAASALRWVDVPDGQYDAGLNRPEAQRVVDLLQSLLDAPKAPTLGVVTFNLKQRQTILDAIDDRVAADPAFAKLWGDARNVEALDERPFVKNLESVQGDERDVIIFSLGHAPVMRKRRGGAEELYVPARFGPLGQRGGERRLNVAISRAKRGCYVVSSFAPRLLHVGNSMHSGPRLFKGYLEFAHAKSEGQHDRADRVLDEVRGTRLDARTAAERRVIDGHLPLATQIACELETRGIPCAQGIGSSQFRIPLAVAKPDADRGEFTLAVLTDEGGRGVSAFDQFVHQPLVLGLRGWDVMHVDAPAWSRRRAEILEQIERHVRSDSA